MKGFRIFGIDIVIHWSLLFAFALVVWGLSISFGNWLAAILAGIVFIFSVLFHEMAHCLTARRFFGIHVRRIILFILGGIAEFEVGQGIFNSPKKEFFISIAGPLSSFFLAGAFWGLSQPFEPTALMFSVLNWLSSINFVLAVFNMIPAFPLDGGRIFRSLCGWKTGDLLKATKIAKNVSYIFAVLLPIGGYFLGGLFITLWLAIISWGVLIPAAEAEYRAVQFDKILFIS